MAALVGLSGLWAWSQIPETTSLARGEPSPVRSEAPEARRREGHRPGITALFTPSFLVVGPVLLGWVADTSGFSWSLGVSAAVVLLAAV